MNTSSDNLLRYDRNQKYLLLDCETCHLNLIWETNLPWQWAWMIATKDNILSERNIYVNWPNLKVSRDAARITGFSSEKVKRLGISPEAACDELDKVIYNPKYKI